MKSREMKEVWMGKDGLFNITESSITSHFGLQNKMNETFKRSMNAKLSLIPEGNDDI